MSSPTALAARERFVDVARFDDVLGCVGVMRPDAGEKIGLQLQPDRELVVFGLADAAARSLHFVRDAEQVLHVMADLMRDDVGLREIAGRAEALAGASGRRRGRCKRADRPGNRTDRWRRWRSRNRIGSGSVKRTSFGSSYCRPILPEERVPDVLGIGQNDGDELRGFVARRVAFDLS